MVSARTRMQSSRMVVQGLALLIVLACYATAFQPATHLGTGFAVGTNRLQTCSVNRPNVGKVIRGGVVSLRASSDDEAKKRAAEEEAERWKEMASKMEAQRSSVSDAPGPQEEKKSIYELSQGGTLPKPSMGELESLMARAEAFKAKQREAEEAAQAAVQAKSANDLPRRFQGSEARTLVGGDAGSRRQAAPYKPGESKAGAEQEGWTEDQLEKILEEEEKWKEQVAEKKREEAMAQSLSANADQAFKLSPGVKVEKGVPSSMESAVMQSLLSVVDVMKRGCGNIRLCVDTSRDETYTTLKNSIPYTRVFAKALSVNGFSNLRIVMPDPGSAALAKRDWAGADGHMTVAFERFGETPIGEDDDAVLVVAAAATEIEKIKKLSLRTAEKGVPLILINPSVKSPGGENLGSLGAYSLGLSEFLGTFETAYFLRTIDWGVIHRQYPDSWAVYEETPRGYVKLEETKGLPSGEQLEEIYLKAHPEEQTEGFGSLAKGVGRFIKNYSKG